MKNFPHKQLQFWGAAFIRMARSYLLFIVLLISQALPVFPKNISFTQITPPKEFPFTSITGITQDTLGYMWFTSGFLSSMSMDDVDNKVKAQSTLRSINESAHKMLDAMNDIIWNIQPQNDTLDRGPDTLLRYFCTAPGGQVHSFSG